VDILSVTKITRLPIVAISVPKVNKLDSLPT
jgi:hypothetical protein